MIKLTSLAARYEQQAYLLLLPSQESVIVLCFVVRYFISILVLQSS